MKLRPKRAKLVTSPGTWEENPCIICNSVKCKGNSTRSRICENGRAKLFLSAIKYNQDEVFTRCIFLKEVGDVFAADLVYHLCTSKYILISQRNIDEIMNYEFERSKNFDCLFEEFVSSLDLKNRAYSLSYVIVVID